MRRGLRALTRKLWRDLLRMRGQALAIALVVGGGVATIVMSWSALDSLQVTRDAFFESSRFADVFSSLVRAPVTLTERIEDLERVAAAETRVAEMARLAVPGFGDQVTALLVTQSPAGGLNEIQLERGRRARAAGEVVALDVFAAAHGRELGQRLTATLDGRRLDLTLVGTARSPEFMYSIRPGDIFPDHERFGVLWMEREALSGAVDMTDALNDVLIELGPGIEDDAVIEGLDGLLEPFGGAGAYAREDQVAYRYLAEEFEQLAGMGKLFPLIFLSVAAFLLHVVIERLIATQREQIAMLAAFGYRPWAIGWHYLQLALVIVLVGWLVGVAAGAWLARGLSVIYADFFLLPDLVARVRFDTALGGLAITAVAALLGVARSIRRAVSLPPAAAMRPAPPSRFKRTLTGRWLGTESLWFSSRMALRQLGRRPLQTTWSVLGLSMSIAIVMVGQFYNDAIELLTEVQFELVQREDLALTFTDPRGLDAIQELGCLPGVLVAEPLRQVLVRLAYEHSSYRCSLTGFPAGGTLRQIVEADQEASPPPTDGLLLTEYLAGRLGAEIGDTLRVEVLDGQQPEFDTQLVATVDELIGMSAYIDLEQVARRLGEEVQASSAVLRLAPEAREKVLAELERRPQVAGTAEARASFEALEETIGGDRADRRAGQHPAGGQHRVRRGLQRGPDRAGGAPAGAGQPARAGVHAGGSHAHPRVWAAGPRLGLFALRGSRRALPARLPHGVDAVGAVPRPARDQREDGVEGLAGRARLGRDFQTLDATQAGSA